VVTIVHASDLQCGRPYLPEAGDAFVALAHALCPDAIVISGDLTQRAKRREYRIAKQLLERLPEVPLVVTPGNHDVPLWRVWERVATPHRNWREAFPGELDTVTRVPGATFVALNSSAPRRAIVNGRLGPAQLRLAERAFAAAPPGDLRVLVVHHHFAPTAEGDGGRPLPGARSHARAFEAMGVDLVLGGHVHRTHVHTSADLFGEGAQAGVPFVACGTTTSCRGRGPERGWNSLNLIRAGTDEIEVRPFLRAPGTRTFEPADPLVFPRRGAARAGAPGSGSAA
jgi:3',5'-cyclic AMP phosphodiesterase CpdA